MKPRGVKSTLCCFVILIALFSCFAQAQSAPSITSISPTVGPVSPVGGSVTIKGTGFGSTQGNNTVTFGGTASTPSLWSDTKIVALVPSSLAPGFVDVIVTVNGASSNAKSFLVIPVITGCSPCSAIIGTPVALTGTSFGDLQGASTITFNGTPASPSSWSNTSITAPTPIGASNGPIVVTVNGFATNGVPFYVLPNILNLQPAIGSVGTSVTITGNGFGQTQNVVSGVTFNGVSATIINWSNTSITATVPQTATTGNVVVTTAANLVSSGVNFTVSSVTSLTLTPSSAAMLVGSGRTLSLVDQNGNGVTGATWTVDNSAAVTLSSDDPPQITALSLGTATVMASLGSLSAQATVSVYAPGPNGKLPAGTVLWSLPPTSGFTPTSMLQAAPGDSDGVISLIALERSNNGNAILRGLTADGQQKWANSIGGESSAIADNNGGALVLGSNSSGQSIAKFDGITGGQVWQVTNRGGYSGLAIHPDGTIYYPFSDPYPGDSYPVVTAIDSDTGSTKPGFPIIPTGFVFENGNVSPVSILPDGFGYVTFLTDSSDFFPETTTLQLLRFDSSGSYTVQQLDSEVNDPTGSGNTYSYCCSGAIIPDGQGGVLVAWQLEQINGHTATFHYNVTHVPAGGSPNPPYDLNYALDHTAIDIKMVLGENNTAFISAANPFGSYKLVAFDVNSGSVNWTWQPPQGHKLEMVVALEGGGVALKDIDTASATQQIARFSASGSISYDGWSTAWLAPDSLSGEDTWNTTNSSAFSNVEETLAAVPANTSWPFMGGNPSGNGSPIAFLQEGIPSWGSLFAKKAKPPKCATVATAPKAQLTGNALARYNDQKQKLLTSGRLDQNDPRSQSCLAFFYEGDPNLPQYFNGLTGAVTNQLVYDGSHSSISLYDSGTWTQDDIDAGVATVEGLKSTPMSCAMDQGTYQTPNGTVAAAQSHPPATDMYINSFNYKMVTQGTILHESMHNLTRLSDRGLKLLLGLHLGGSATDDINHILEENGCAGTN